MGYYKQAVIAAEEIILEQFMVDAVDYVEDYQQTKDMAPHEVVQALSEYHPKGAIGFLFDQLAFDIGIWDGEEDD